MESDRVYGPGVIGGSDDPLDLAAEEKIFPDVYGPVTALGVAEITGGEGIRL